MSGSNLYCYSFERDAGMMEKTKYRSLLSTPERNIFSHAFIEMFKEGVIVISQKLQPLYINLKAKAICQQIWHCNYLSDSLPSVISEISDRIINTLSCEDRILVIDYQVSEEQIIRMRVNYLNVEVETEANLNTTDYPWLLIFLEDRSQILQEELKIQQKKYNLTNRETEIMRLLSQTYSYQDIAQKMQLSLNTVKFHIKNIYAKKREMLASHKIYFELER
jgi:predicted DNA-binding protein (UPF0251 family)